MWRGSSRSLSATSITWVNWGSTAVIAIASVENSSFAGYRDADLHDVPLANLDERSDARPVRASYRDDKSISWTRVNALPDFVYFDHSIHVSKGVGCTTCHGAVAEMPLTWRAPDAHMSWCLDCHRAPEKYVRRDPRYSIHLQGPANQIQLGLKLVNEYKYRG